MNDIRKEVLDWVNTSTSHICTEMLVKLYMGGIAEMKDVTPVSEGDDVWDEWGDPATVLGVKKVKNGTLYELENECGDLEINEYMPEKRNLYFPMWNTMPPRGSSRPLKCGLTLWKFDDWADEEWLNSKKGLETMASCGFTVIDTPYGTWFGIDGGGYDFVEAHWIPLWKKMRERNYAGRNDYDLASA